MPKFNQMAKEIERKFLVKDSSYRQYADKIYEIQQAYISTDPDRTVRVRVKDRQAYLTVKTRNQGCVRNEWEFSIDVASACEMITNCCGSRIFKTRYCIPSADGFCWEVDEFHGVHEGLVVAEIELPSPETAFIMPSFIGEEVTGDPRYYNSSLAEG